jgi:hypothetical protein
MAFRDSRFAGARVADGFFIDGYLSRSPEVSAVGGESSNLLQKSHQIFNAENA